MPFDAMLVSVAVAIMFLKLKSVEAFDARPADAGDWTENAPWVGRVG